MKGKLFLRRRKGKQAKDNRTNGGPVRLNLERNVQVVESRRILFLLKSFLLFFRYFRGISQELASIQMSKFTNEIHMSCKLLKRVRQALN